MRVLVATDIASRGIDVKGIELVVNFDLPMDSSDYVHRIGRTARAGAEGHAISFAMPSERGGIRDIERLIRKPVPVSQLPETIPGPRANITSAPSYGGSRPPYRGGGFRGGPRRPYSGGASRGPSGFQIRTGGGSGRRFSRTPRHKR